jgi:acyl-coenzyme A thioesterase PaaI-like protein
VTPLEYLGATEQDDGWSLRLPRSIHGAFGGVTGGALAAAAVAISRGSAPGRTAVGLDVHFVRGLASEDASAKVDVLSSGRSLTVVRVEFSDDTGRRTTAATVTFAEPSALAALESDVPATHLGPPPTDLVENSKPWRAPPNVDVPIIDTAQPRAARMGDAIATVVTVPWEPDADGAEGSCLAADLSVGPPVDAVPPKGSWVPHPNPDISLRFAGPVASSDLVAVAACRRTNAGVATVESEVWDGPNLVATAISTSLFMAKR